MRAKTTPPSLLILYYFTLKYEKEQYKIENMPKIYEHIYRNTYIQHYVYYNTVACVRPFVYQAAQQNYRKGNYSLDYNCLPKIV